MMLTSNRKKDVEQCAEAWVGELSTKIACIEFQRRA